MVGGNSHTKLPPAPTIKKKKKSLFPEGLVVKSMDFGYVQGQLHNICMLEDSYLKNRENSLILYLYICRSLEQCQVD